MINEKQVTEFLKLLTKLNPIEFAGFCKVMNIPMLKDKEEPLPAEQLINSLLTKFCQSNRQKRRRILKVLRIGGGVGYGANAELSKEDN